MRPLKFISRLLFYKILVKFYYGFFRLRQSGWTGKPIQDLQSTRLRHLLLFILIILILILNFGGSGNTKGASAETYKTVLAKLIPNEFGDIADQEFIEDKSPADSLLDVPDKYIDEETRPSNLLHTNLETDYSSSNIAFSNDNDSVFKPNFLVVAGDINSSVANVAKRQEIVYYSVGAGDTISTIAKKFNISVNTILWANNLSAFSLIRPGDKLMILPSSGVLHVVAKGDTLGKIAKNYGVSEDQISSSNSLGEHLVIGQKLIIPGGKKLSTATIAKKPSSNSVSGVGVISNLIKSPKAPAAASKMNWPAGAYRITQYFSWRHPGVDIAAKVGTPIYAADSGVVITAQGGWNGGYGNTIVIDHGGGKKTRYAHMSKLFVKVGDSVDKGENIGAMGSTGRSTGSHLHFEVIISGVKYNPLNYIR